MAYTPFDLGLLNGDPWDEDALDALELMLNRGCSSSGTSANMPTGTYLVPGRVYYQLGEGRIMVYGGTNGWVPQIMHTAQASRPTGMAGLLFYETDTPRSGNTGAATTPTWWRHDGTNYIRVWEPTQTSNTSQFTGVTGGGSHTFDNEWQRNNGECTVKAQITFAGTPSSITSFAWVPPVAAAGISLDQMRVNIYDSSSGTWSLLSNSSGTTSIPIVSRAVSGTMLTTVAMSVSVPIPVAVNDVVVLTGRFRMSTPYL